MKRKTKKKPQFAPLVWVQIKTLYASGKFSSIKELHAYLTQTMKGPLPTWRTIQVKYMTEHWSKTEVKEKEDEILAKTYADRFEKAGLGDQATVDYIAAGVKHAEILMKKATEALAEAYKGKDPKVIEAAQEQARAAVLELRTQLRFIEERNKLVGAHAATKVRIPGIQGLADDLKDLHAMSNPELDREINERYHRLMSRKKHGNK
jgi:hypothetical protein